MNKVKFFDQFHNLKVIKNNIDKNILLRIFINAIFNYEKKLENNESKTSKKEMLNEVFKNKFILHNLEKDFEKLIYQEDDFLENYLNEAKKVFENKQFKDVCIIENNGELTEVEKREIQNLIKKEWNRKTKFKKAEIKNLAYKSKKIDIESEVNLQLADFIIFDFNQFKIINENLINIKENYDYSKLYSQFIKEAVKPMLNNFFSNQSKSFLSINNLKELLFKNSLIVIYNTNSTNLEIKDDLLENNFEFINTNLLENNLPIVEFNPKNNFFHSLTSCFYYKKISKIDDLFFKDKVHSKNKDDKENVEDITFPEFEEKVTFDNTSILDSSIPLGNLKLDEEIAFPEIVVEEPVVEEPVVEAPDMEEPVVEEPVMEAPVVEEPVMEEPVVEEPVVEEPVVEETIILEEFIAFDPTIEFVDENNEIKTIEFKEKEEIFGLSGDYLLDIWKEVIPIEKVKEVQEGEYFEVNDNSESNEIDNDETSIEEMTIELEEDLILKNILEEDLKEPVVEEPVEEAPVVEESVEEAPVMEEPVVEAPVMEEPVVEEPVVEEPVVEAPVVEAPVVEAPVVEAPVVEESVVEESVVEESVVEESVVEESVVVKKNTKKKRAKKESIKEDISKEFYDKVLDNHDKNVEEINDDFINNTFEMVFENTLTTEVTEDFVYLKNNKSLPEVMRWAVYFEYFMDQFQIQKDNLIVNSKKYDKNKFKKFEENLRYMNIEETYEFLKENSSMIFNKIYNREVDSLFALRVYTLFLHVQSKFEESQTLITNWKRGQK
ncbi:hypothetical protein [Spiroplasma endosymbiont of Panorpa germanica]|uniref:hypothetical protein n=1 Tax=Spiroplasma endosymbiont of Panorpa germanica TaxID=3066314 RepID=UPI0030CF3B04